MKLGSPLNKTRNSDVFDDTNVIALNGFNRLSENYAPREANARFGRKAMTRSLLAVLSLSQPINVFCIDATLLEPRFSIPYPR